LPNLWAKEKSVLAGGVGKEPKFHILKKLFALNGNYKGGIVPCCRPGLCFWQTKVGNKNLGNSSGNPGLNLGERTFGAKGSLGLDTPSAFFFSKIAAITPFNGLVLGHIIHSWSIPTDFPLGYLWRANF